MPDKITWTNEVRKLRELVPWSRNPRQITKDQAKRLIESFDQFGQVETIAVGPSNEVFNGHQRLAVLIQQHGPDYEVEVRVSSRALTEKEREKLTIFLHRGAAGEWNWDILANEFDFGDLLEWGFSEKELQVYGEEDKPEPKIIEKYMVLIECADEQEQLDLLEKFHEEGLNCRALIS
jgi:ParB-like chromosome segregation protein Spo0J